MRVGIEQRVAQRARARAAFERLCEIGAGDLENPANEREAVRVRAARRESEQHVAGFDPRAVDGLRLLHDADGEAREIVFAGHEGVRVLGGLAADERASGHLASGGDALQHVGGDVDVEALAHEVVEEEERLGALHQDVVDAHRDEIDADRVVPVEREGELQLRADAVGAGDQHRLPVALRKLDQRAEAADAGEHFGPHRPGGERLDALDERVAGVDVDAGVAIGKTGRRGRAGRCHGRGGGRPEIGGAHRLRRPAGR